jgi:hypothetical protein
VLCIIKVTLTYIFCMVNISKVLCVFFLGTLNFKTISTYSIGDLSFAWHWSTFEYVSMLLYQLSKNKQKYSPYYNCNTSTMDLNTNLNQGKYGKAKWYLFGLHLLCLMELLNTLNKWTCNRYYDRWLKIESVHLTNYFYIW